MVYAALIGVLVAAGALALERLVASTGQPRRFVWMAALALAVVVPLAGGLREPREPIAPAATLDPTHSESSAPETIRERNRLPFVQSLPIPASLGSARAAAIAWGAGSAGSLTALCIVLGFVARARRRWERKQVDGTDVYVSPRFGPALVGIAAPRVVIPSWVLELPPAARATILRHEQEHARARDHLTLLYAGLVAAVFPWSPAIWWMCRRLRAAVEMDCDQRVIAGGIGPADYGAVLLHAGSRSHGRWGLAPAISQPKSLLERRLRTMSEKRKRLNAAHGALLAAAGLVALGIACDVPAPTQLDEAIDAVVAAGTDAAPPTTDLTTVILLEGTRQWDLEEAARLRYESASRDYSELRHEPSGGMYPHDPVRIEVIKGWAAPEMSSGIDVFTTEGRLELYIYEDGKLREATREETNRYTYQGEVLSRQRVPDTGAADLAEQPTTEVVDFNELFRLHGQFERAVVWRRSRDGELGRIRALLKPVSG